jgi:hypothetical protein
VGLLVEVLAVDVGEVTPDGPLLGANLDTPTAGRQIAARALEIGGWALGHEGAPEEIEVSLGTAILSRAPLRQARPDIAAAFPGIPDAKSAGFEIGVDASGGPAESAVEVRARFSENAVPIGSLRLRRLWRGDLRAEPQPLVSVIISSHTGEDRGLGRTLRSVGEQRYGPTEVLVAHFSSSPPGSLADWVELGVRAIATVGGGPATLRNEGIRRSDGQLLFFVDAGLTVAESAFSRGVEMLAQRPEACAVLDAVEGREVAAMLYRRSAFEELRGFEDGVGRPCDLELARRSAAYDALFRPGALVQPGGG